MNYTSALNPPLFDNCKLITAATEEPLTLAEAKEHLRVTHSAEDASIQSWLIAARGYVEDESGRALIESTWDLYLDEFPYCDEIKIPKGRLKSITSLKYFDLDGIETVWPASNYNVDTVREPGRLSLARYVNWPSTTLQPTNAVVIRFVAGYPDAASVPAGLKSAMKLLISHWYINREAVVVGNSAEAVSEELKIGVERLIAHKKIWAF